MNKRSAIRSLIILLSWSIVISMLLVICIQLFYNHSCHATSKKSNKSAFTQEDKHLQLVHTLKLHCCNLRIARNTTNSCIKNIHLSGNSNSKYWPKVLSTFFSTNNFNRFICCSRNHTIFFQQMRI